jgi:hypothetical protein
MTVHSAALESSRTLRPPPTAVKLLLPIWGFRYITQFLEFGLPTLLAPGNIPAVAALLPCEFHLMTSAADAPMFAEHPAWQMLQTICSVKIELIDDLITDGNHSTTITLAFSRAVRAAGPQMTDTCFINICADYLFSDHALDNVMKSMYAGASVVLAGNFQIVGEDGLGALRHKIDPARVELPISSRELIRCGITYMHPASVANIVNFGLFHNEHTNRLFWRVDDSTLIGRFYLMHVVCIRPEVTEFVVGSSFDYSFVPELCPSNNVAIIADSDDYFVLELQTRNHEASQLRPGPHVPATLAVSLAEWTTARHRENAESTVVFHTKDIPDAILSKVTAEADAFMAKVGAGLQAPPQPYRNHPYWIGAIMAHRRATGQPDVTHTGESEFSEQPESASPSSLALLWRLRMALYGTFPELGVCHPFWPDFHIPLQKLEKLLSENKRALIVSSAASAYTAWLARRSSQTVKMETVRLLNMTDLQYRSLFGAFDVCFVNLTERDVKFGDVFIDRVAPLLKPDGLLLLLANNTNFDETPEFAPSFAFHSVRFGNLSLWLSDIHYISSTNWRAFVQRKIVAIGRMARRTPPVGLVLGAIFGVPLLIASYLCNRRAAVGTAVPPRHAHCSSVFMEFRPSDRTEDGWRPRFAVAGESVRPSDGTESIAQPTNVAAPAKIAQSDTSNEDLVSVLARYKFAARLLSGRANVCQIGYSELHGPELVGAAVKSLVVYVAKTEVTPATLRRYQANSKIKMQIHDLGRERLPASYDAIYSFDALERIAPEQEDGVVRHMRESLSSGSDVVIIGCPGHVTAAIAGGIDRVHRRSGLQLQMLVSQHFDTVLMFSMVENDIQAGLLPGADYFIAVASSRRG